MIETKLTPQKYRFSASRLDTWMSCPLQARFQYVDKLPRKTSASATFGKCIHHALDYYNKSGNLDSALLLFIDVWDNPEKLHATPDTWPKGTSYGSYRQRGLDVLRTYHDTNRWVKRKVVATEHGFVVPFGEFELHGFVDLVEMTKDSKKPEVRIVDYKTNKKKPTLQALRLNMQMTVYAYAAMQPEFWQGTEEFPAPIGMPELWPQVEGVKPKTIWYHLDTQKEIYAGARDDRDFMRMYRACIEIRKAIEHDVYVPDISGESCVWCPYTEPCGVKIKMPGEDE